jgi:hypothetical protein
VPDDRVDVCCPPPPIDRDDGAVAVAVSVCRVIG